MSDPRCICQDQHRRGRCREPTCPFRLLGYDYGFDVGNLHVIDYRLWLADLPIYRHPTVSHLRISPADWSRS